MKFYLNGNLITDEPDGDIITTIKRDSKLGGFLITNDSKLKWHGNGFDYIQSVINSVGFCGEIDCAIWDECNGAETRIFVGKMFILEIEKDSNCIITSPVQDNNFYARIDKNKSIEITIDTTRSKNAVTITPAATNAITMFNPATGVAVLSTRQGYRVYDVFKNMVAFMSDGEVLFDSTLFGINGEFEGLSIMYGQEIAFAATGTAPKISFDKFFTEIKKKTNCTIFIDASGAIPILRIEKYGDLFQNIIQRRFENVQNVKYKLDTSKLIATISVGSNTVNDVAVGLGVSFVESNIYQTYKLEDYTSLEQCNTDSRLDLVSDFVISSNVIEELLITPTTKNTDKICFVDCDTLVVVGSNYTSSAILGNPFAVSPPYFYNTRLMNNEVLDRWVSLIPNAIASFQGTVNNLFRASYTSNIFHAVSTYTPYFPFQFNDDFNFPNFDGNGIVNNYGNGTAQGAPVSQVNSRYTCTSDGEHVFYHQIKVNVIGTAGAISRGFIRYTSGGVFIESTGVLDGVSGNPFSTQIISHQANFNCNAGDYIEINVTVDVGTANPGVANPGIYLIGSTNEIYFSCNTAPNSGGIFNLFNNQNIVPLIKADFEYPVTGDEFAQIKLNPFEKIAFTYNDTDLKVGWIDTFRFNHSTTEKSKVTLIGTQEMLN